MADQTAVAKKRAIAEARLRTAAAAAGESFGVPFAPPLSAHARKHPQLYAAQLVENVAEFLEKITQTPKAKGVR